MTGGESTAAAGAAPAVLDRIRGHLRGLDIAFRELRHEPTHTSEESARVRGEALETGAKAILLKVDDRFALFVLPASRRLDSGALKRELGVKRIRFASPEELAERAALVPGAVPPFGEPILPFELFVDTAVERNERVAFNAGSLTDSIIMRREDWRRAAGGTLIAFSKE